VIAGGCSLAVAGWKPWDVPWLEEVSEMRGPVRSLEDLIDEQREKVHTEYDAIFSWKYEPENEKLARLYEKAKTAQWNAATDIDWSIEVDPTSVDGNLAQAALLAAPDSPFKGISKGMVEELAVETQAWTVSQFLHGEQGALLACAKIVDSVPFEEAKLYGATQVIDEARHVEVFNRYLTEKLGRSYPINPNLKALLVDLISDSRWDITYLGMQVMVESLALAAFGFIHQTTNEPLLREITKRVMADEARHVAFGIISLEGLYDDMPRSELADREEFVCQAAELMRNRLVMREVFEKMGLDGDAAEEFIRNHPIQKEFTKQLFSKLVPNVKRIGLLTPRVREAFDKLGVLGFENLPATA
jgi:hypothetical protein